MAFNSQLIEFYWCVATSTNVTTASSELVGEVKSVGGPSGSSPKIDITNLADSARAFLVGMRDEGELSLSVFYNPTTAAAASMAHGRMKDDMDARTKRSWGIKLVGATGGTTVGGASTHQWIKGMGYVSGMAFSGAVDEPYTCDVSIVISSAVKISTGTSF